MKKQDMAKGSHGKSKVDESTLIGLVIVFVLILTTAFLLTRIKFATDSREASAMIDCYPGEELCIGTDIYKCNSSGNLDFYTHCPDQCYANEVLGTAKCVSSLEPTPASSCGSGIYPQCKYGSCTGGKVCKQSGTTCKCVTPSTTHSITVRALGTPAQGLYPQFQIIIAGRVEKTFTVNGTMNSYRYARSWVIDPRDVRIKFINDAYINGEDRNLRVDWIAIDDGTVYQTETSSTYSTGTYSASNGCGAGYKLSEWLHCNGYFQYLAR